VVWSRILARAFSPCRRTASRDAVRRDTGCAVGKRRGGTRRDPAALAAEGRAEPGQRAGVGVGPDALITVLYGDPWPAELRDLYSFVPQGESAELIADRWQISREEMDEFAVRSHQLAAAALQRVPCARRRPR
jgi:acetyl-CoA acetyltransferase